MTLDQLLEEIKAKEANASKAEEMTVLVVTHDEHQTSVKIEVVDAEYTNQYDVQLFLKKYDVNTKKWNESEEQVERVNEQLAELKEGLSLDNIDTLVGETIKVYINDQFKGSLKPQRVNLAKKFEESHYKADFKATITNCYDNGFAIIFNVSPSDDLSVEKIFAIKRNYSAWNEQLKKSMKKPAEFMYRYSQLEEEFGTSELSELIGKEVNVKVYKNPNGKGFHGRMSVPKSV